MSETQQFFRGVASQLSIHHRRIFIASQELKRRALEINHMEYLPMDVRTIIASKMVATSCYDMFYSKILETWLYLNIESKKDDFNFFYNDDTCVTLVTVDYDSDVYIGSRIFFQINRRNDIPRNVPNFSQVMIPFVDEIIESDSWEYISKYINSDSDFIRKDITSLEKIRIDSKVVTYILSHLSPWNSVFSSLIVDSYHQENIRIYEHIGFNICNLVKGSKICEYSCSPDGYVFTSFDYPFYDQ